MNPINLRYTDFISPGVRVVPLLKSLESQLAMQLDFIPPTDTTRSGPRLDEAVATFADGSADFGRI